MGDVDASDEEDGIHPNSTLGRHNDDGLWCSYGYDDVVQPGKRFMIRPELRLASGSDRNRAVEICAWCHENLKPGWEAGFFFDFYIIPVDDEDMFLIALSFSGMIYDGLPLPIADRNSDYTPLFYHPHKPRDRLANSYELSAEEYIR